MYRRTALVALAAIILTSVAAPSAAAEGRAVVISGAGIATDEYSSARRTVVSGDPIEAGDTVGFEEGSLAGIEFEDGTSVFTTSGMLLRVGESGDGRELTLLFGEALVVADTAPVRLQLMDGVVNLPDSATALVTAGMDRSEHVDLLEGAAQVRWSTGSFLLTENQRAWPIADDLPWGKRTLGRRELSRRSRLLASQGWPEGFVPQVTVTGGVFPTEPLYRAPGLCMDGWHHFPWIECRLSGYDSCACWDARDWRGFDTRQEEAPDPTTIVHAITTGSGSDDGEAAEKDLPEEPEDSPDIAPIDGIGDPPLVLVLGTRPDGTTLVWRGRSAASKARSAKQRTGLFSDSHSSGAGFSSSSSSSSMLSSSIRASSSYTNSSGGSSYRGTPTSTRSSGLRRSDPRKKRKK
jgi:hypothetical protein